MPERDCLDSRFVVASALARVGSHCCCLAYRGEEAAAKSNAERIDNNLRFLLVSFSSNRWLSLRLELLGGAVVFGCALFIVLPVRGVDAVMTGALAGSACARLFMGRPP